MNQVILIGNLGQDPEVHTFENGDKVTRVTLATSQRWKNKHGEKQERTEWHSLQFWGKGADAAAQYLKKGSKIAVNGEIQYNIVEKDGVTKNYTKIKVNSFEFLDKKPEGGVSNQPAPAKTAQQQNFDNDFPTDPPLF